MADDPFKSCEEAVRRHDPDRFFAALFAHEDKRRHLFALTALNYELVHAVRAAREPMLVQIRLAWWAEAVEAARAGKPRGHAVAKALAETLAACDLPGPLFETLIAARGEPGPLTDADAVRAHADATAGALMRLWAKVLGVEIDVRDAAIAFATAGRHGGLFGSVDTNVLAEWHFTALRSLRIPRAALPVVLPAALVPLYLKNPDPPLWRKQIALLVAALRGRI